MKRVYRRIDTRTEKGISAAEKLLKNGWKIGSYGIFEIDFYKIIYNK